jgi:phage/plasmid-associated DNA primase
MEFEKSDLLTYSQLSSLIDSNYTVIKASNIATKLKKYIFIDEADKKLCVLQKNITYLKFLYAESKLLTYVSSYIQESYQSLSPKDKNKMNDKTKYHVIFSNANIKTYLPQLTEKIGINNIEFDKYTNKIHFNNGYINLEKLIFYKRTIGRDYITDYIKYDYKKSTEEEQNQLMHHVKKIYSNSEDLESILYTIGSALSGYSNIDQKVLFLLGIGSSGKSFIMKLTMKAFQCYLKEFQDDIFMTNNSKIDKILNTFITAPYIRISWINELKDSKIDSSFFKKFIDGEIQTTKLYKDKSYNFSHYSKPIITANTFPNINIDSGTSRRLIGYTHKSLFVEDKKN